MVRLTERQLVNVIKTILNEVKYIKNPNYNTYNFEPEKNPLNDNETIRVYHGFNTIDDAIIVAKQGLSGKSTSKQHKVYSYEVGNNPYGLFVSSSFDIVKNRFAHSGVIMEFSAKVSDLEAPVWSGQNSYFGQGSQTKSFKDRNDREQQRLNYRKNTIDDESLNKNLPNINKSDRPELAKSLIDSTEKQALFIGDLNPNGIKRFWVHDNIIKNRKTVGTFKSISRDEFLKYYGNKEISNYQQQNHEQTLYKLFYPNDNFDLNKLNPMNRYKTTPFDKSELVRIIDKINNKNGIEKDYSDGELPVRSLELVRYLLWPKQIIQAIGKDNYNKYYNQFF